MIFANSSIRRIDLDALERQLRDFVVDERRLPQDVKERDDRRFDADARQFLVRATVLLDTIAHPAAAAQGACAPRSFYERSVASRCARALAAPLLLLAIGTAAVVVMLVPVGDGPATSANPAAKERFAKMRGNLLKPSQAANPNHFVMRDKQAAEGVVATVGEAETVKAHASPNPMPLIKVDDLAELLPARVVGTDQTVPDPARAPSTPDQTAAVPEQGAGTVVASTTAAPGDADTAQALVPSGPVIAVGPISASMAPVNKADDVATQAPARVADADLTVLGPAPASPPSDEVTEVAEQSAGVVDAPMIAPPGEAGTSQRPAFAGGGSAFAVVSASPVPVNKADDVPVEPPTAVADTDRRVVDRTPSPPPSDAAVAAAEQSAGVVAALSSGQPGEAETAGAPSSPSRDIALGPVSAGPAPVVDIENAAEDLPARVAESARMEVARSARDAAHLPAPSDQATAAAEQPADVAATASPTPSDWPRTAQATAPTEMSLVPVTGDLPARERPSDASSPSSREELIGSSIAPRTLSTGDEKSEGRASDVADQATPQAPASLPAFAPSSSASPKAEAIASAASVPDELVFPSATPRTHSSDGETEGQASVAADEPKVQPPVSPPSVTPSPPQALAQATPGTPINPANPPAVRLIIGQASSRGTGEALLLNVSLSNAPAGARIDIKGLAAGSTLNVGRASGTDGWQLTAADLPDVRVRPPQGFVGAMELALDLRLATDRVADHKTVHLEWIASAAAQTTKPAFVVRHLETGELAALVKRGESLIASGDLASARLVLQRAAEAGEAQAALSLAGTYDPIALKKLGLQGPTPDIEKARTWYKRAQELGSAAAPERLQLLAGYE